MAKLTPKQKEFLESLVETPELVDQDYFGCEISDGRTAISLQKKGLVEFEDGEFPDVDDEWFHVKITLLGLQALDLKAIAVEMAFQSAISEFNDSLRKDEIDWDSVALKVANVLLTKSKGSPVDLNNKVCSLSIRSLKPK